MNKKDDAANKKSGKNKNKDEEKFAPYGEAYTEAKAEKPERKKLSEGQKAALAIVACLLVVAIIAGSVLHFTGKGVPGISKGGENRTVAETQKELGPSGYAFVFVHGVGGWGDSSSMNDVGHYWGATTGDLAQYMRNKGYEVCVPTVGPYSSTWDRTCELYAQLTGTTVDYGEAHSKEHNHERYGRKYEKPLVENWGKDKKVNLIGHSFGGETVRMLASLLAYGDDAEKKATGDETSPLFTGGKGDWVFSVTTLSSPHNGSQLTEMAEALGRLFGVDNSVDLMVAIVYSVLATSGIDENKLNLMLDQFGVGEYKKVQDALDAFVNANDDHAFAELSPDGAAALNKRIKTVDGVYYFSYAYSTTNKNESTGSYSPQKKTFATLFVPSSAMCRYTCTTQGGIEIDEKWFDNDGLVSVYSAQYPRSDSHCALPANPSEIKTGIWNVAPTQDGDHGSPVGLAEGPEAVHTFYEGLFEMLEKVNR
ncbi:MAG: hypothetical protein II702_01135 [Clostridia bacterium]|nr:hypothetical protein [Clostridia bacterium]